MKTARVTSVESPWLTTKGVMDYLGVSRDWVDDRRREGILPFFRVGNTVFMKVSDVDRMIEKRRITV